MHSSKIAVLGVTLVLAIPGMAASQVAWDAPSLMRPGSPSGLSILLLDAYPSDELGVMATWRASDAPAGLGFRVGLADGAGGDLAFMGGIDVSGSLAELDGAGDPSVMWWSGAGLGVGNELLASFPLGLVFGWRGSSEGVVFLPYAGAHASLDILTGPGDDLDLDASVDLGLDVGWGSGFMARLGVSIGGRDALAVGVRLPT